MRREDIEDEEGGTSSPSRRLVLTSLHVYLLVPLHYTATELRSFFKRRGERKKKKMAENGNAVEVDWYAILNCSIDSTKEQIEKAARQLARKYHPDRNKDPKAAPLFLNVQKAKDFLLDESKRRGYDENIRKKIKRKEYDQQRHQHMDSKRKKMKEDLEERLGKAQKTSQSSNETFTPKQKSGKKEADEIRKESMSRMSEARAKQEAEYHNISQEEILKHRESMSDTTNKDTIVQVKVKWRRSDISHSDDSLCGLFRSFGDIEDVTMSVGGKANSAIITFASPIAAQAAVNHYLDSSSFKVSLLTNEPKKSSIFTHTYQNTSTNVFSQSSREFSSHSNDRSSPGNMESDLMREVRRAVERDELIKQMASVTSNPLSKGTFSSFPSHPIGTQQNPPETSSAHLVAKENDILARMMAAKSSKPSSVSLEAPS